MGEDDISPKDKAVIAKMKNDVQYIVDDGCASPLFTANDISLQEIAVDGKKNKEWVALVQLDSTSKDGYLQNELGHCKTLDYVPQTRVSVEVKLRTPTKKYCTYRECVTRTSDDRRRRRRRRLQTNLKGCIKWETKTKHCGWTYPYLPATHYHTKRPLEYTVD